MQNDKIYIFDDNVLESIVYEDNNVNDNIVTQMSNQNNNSTNTSNNLTSSFNFPSTLFNSDLNTNNFTELDYCDYDFSQLIPGKGDDVMSNIAYLDLVSNFCKRKKLAENKHKNEIKIKSSKKDKYCKISNQLQVLPKNKNINKTPYENSNILQTDEINKNKINFYIRKVHHKLCNCDNEKISKVKRNKIKTFVKDDLETIIKNERDRKTHKIINLLNSIKLKIFDKSNNRNFRLFDKDVIIKKICSNFLKFTKLIFDLLVEKNLYKNRNNILCNKKINSRIKIKLKKIYTVEQFKELLNLNLYEIFEDDKNSDLDQFPYIKNMKLYTFFSKYFINLKYFNNYLLNKIQLRYNSDYLNCFLYYIKNILL